MLMPHMPATARESLDHLLKVHIAPDLRALGFKKHTRTFHRRRGSILQLIHFEASWTSSQALARFHISMSIWSDQVGSLQPLADIHGPYVLPKTGIPAQSNCHWGTPIHLAFPKFAHIEFECRVNSGNEQLEQHIRDAVFNHLVPSLDQLDSEAALLQHIRRTNNPNLATPPLIIAALYRVVGTLRDFDDYAKAAMNKAEGDPELAAIWSTSLRRMRQTRVYTTCLPPTPGSTPSSRRASSGR
jgi:hypothetical protein